MRSDLTLDQLVAEHAKKLRDLEAMISARLPGRLEPYTPTWQANAGGTPVIGDGTLTGRFCTLGPVIYFQARLVIGSTTTQGTGPWRLGTPTIADLTIRATGALRIEGAPAAAQNVGVWGLVQTTGIGMWDLAGARFQSTSGLAAGDILEASGTYVPA